LHLTLVVLVQFGGGFTAMPFGGDGDDQAEESPASASVVEATSKFTDAPVVRSRVKESKSAPAIRKPQDAVAARKAAFNDEEGLSSAISKLCESSFAPAQSAVDQTQKPVLPLHFFENNDHDDPTDKELLMKIATGEVDVPIKSTGFFTDEYTGEGSWQDCHVMDYNADTEEFGVQWANGTSQRVHRLHVCAETANRDNFGEKYKAARELRSKAESVIRFNAYIESMPVEECPEMDPEQVTRIEKLATSSLNQGDWDNVANVEQLLSEVGVDYIVTINKLIFDANRANLMYDMPELQLPEEEAPSPPQMLGVIATPPHDMDEQSRGLVASTAFLTSSAAVNSMMHVRTLCNNVLETRCFFMEHDGPMTLDEFKDQQALVNQECARALADWSNIMSQTLKSQLGDEDAYPVMESMRSRYTGTQLARLLTRVNLMMSDSLIFLTRDVLQVFTEYILKNSMGEVDVVNCKQVDIIYPCDIALAAKDEDPEAWVFKQRLAAVQAPPRLFAIALIVAEKTAVTNQAEVDQKAKDIVDWWANEAPTDEEERAKAECPFEPIEPIIGQVFGYDTDLADFTVAVTNSFDKVMHELQSIPSTEMLVMDRLYWQSKPNVKSTSSDEPWVKDAVEHLATAVEHATAPLHKYLTTYSDYLDFLNLDVTEYMASLEKEIVSVDEDADEDDEGGAGALVNVNLPKLKETIEKHRLEMADVLDKIPSEIVQVGGLYSLDVSAIRDLLAAKHDGIVRTLLEKHSSYCEKLCAYLTAKFEDVFRKIGVVPKDIEQLSEIKEYMGNVNKLLEPLEDSIEKLQDWNELLSDAHWKTSVEQSNNKWTCVSWPKQIGEKMEDSAAILEDRKTKYMAEMETQQEVFVATLDTLMKEAGTFSNFKDIKQVDHISDLSKKFEAKLEKAVEDSMLYNNRESLFDKEMTDYDQLGIIKKSFEPYNQLWQTAGKWINTSKQWSEGMFTDLDAEAVEQYVDEAFNTINKAFKYFTSSGQSECASIADEIRNQVTAFKPNVPFIVSMRNPGMRGRHWEQISDSVGFQINPEEQGLTLAQVLEMDLSDHTELFQKISESAGKEYQIELALNNMVKEWENISLDIYPYRDTGTSVLKGVDEITAVLDEHITMTQAMQFSAFKKPFEDRIEEWDKSLMMVSDVLEEWMAVQRSWMYLQPIFESPDINKQLPAEGKRFSAVDKNWRQSLSNAKAHPKCVTFCNNEKLLARFREGNILLDQVQKGLSDYLETKRSSFARFYFLSNDELLSILSESKDVKLVQPHLKKCFEGVYMVHFEPDLKITQIHSREKEMIECFEPVDPVGKNVEHWMDEVEKMMVISVRDIMYRSVLDYQKKHRKQWMQDWAGMFVLNGSQVHWTREIEKGLNTGGLEGLKKELEKQKHQLADMVVLVRGELTKNARNAIGALTVIDVHARDVVINCITNGVADPANFLWSSQLRYYWVLDEEIPNPMGHDILEGGDLQCAMVQAVRPYGYEYLGNTFRLVITPLTDKCYLTLMGAMQMILGGAPAGPAGTGKTETTKDLAKALAKQCVVFNCGDGLDYLAMGKFFKGLASCGAWACFDEFNRINIEVLSVVGQQVSTIQRAIQTGKPRIIFEESDIRIDPGFGVFITMNPGYAGRSALPDSLSALFRPVAMMVPDYALIGEIMFFAFGFSVAKICGAKMVTTFKLCSEQLSSQSHYDYGMRAVKTVITAAGNLKRVDPDMDEEVLLLRALQDVNRPKFLSFDLPLFAGIISDLFPGKRRPDIDLGALIDKIKICADRQGLQPHPFFLGKTVQLYETICVRHGLMVVGPTGGGKSSNISVLAAALTELKKLKIAGIRYEKVKKHQLNPKSITMGQLYGQFDPNTHEWQDGILVCLYRGASEDPVPDSQWVIFDGPVDAIWIENMNTVLDDNKKLCLNSGEMVTMSSEMTMMFEPEDLSVASPATVSRCGMVYMEPESLGFFPLVTSWLEYAIPPKLSQAVKTKIQELCDVYLQASIDFVRAHLSELVPTVDNNLVCSLFRILDCFYSKFVFVDGEKNVSQEAIDDVINHVEPQFMFALIWSVGATVNDQGRVQFSAYLRSEMAQQCATKKIPTEGFVYDYIWLTEKGKWTKWMDTIDAHDVNPKLDFSEVVVPTMDSVRNTFLLETLMTNNKHVLMVGESGTGKTVNIGNYLGTMPDKYIPIMITFSAQTGCNLTQDSIDGKLEKRKKGVFGPTAGKRFFIYVDDLNMPKREEYGAQPPIEILRQWFDQSGWYDRQALVFRKIIDCQFIASMGPPGGGRNPITPRFLRHFNIIGYAQMSDESKALIFSSILSVFLRTFPSSVQACCTSTVNATVELYNEVCKTLLPTPIKPHYTFNLRDLGKVFQGCLMSSDKCVQDDTQFMRLWVHECTRTFEDRMINEQDHSWFQNLVNDLLVKHFKSSTEKVVTSEYLIYGDYMFPGADPKLYQEITDMTALRTTIDEYLHDYNAESKSPMPLVMFLNAIEHVSRVSRVIRQPQGNALLLGVGGSGRQSMTKMATYMAGFKCVQVEIAKGYGKAEWREDIKNVLLQAGAKNTPIVFLFSDVQIVDEIMVEDLNNVLNAGDIPNLYAAEDLDTIASACRVECQKRKIPPTKINIFTQYIVRVRKNIHVCLAMSPIGEAFRTRLRMFPALVNCCTIDWFSAWPAEALDSVAQSSLHDAEPGSAVAALHAHPEIVDNMVTVFKDVHQSVEKASTDYYETMRRYFYVTPTSYLELLSTFKTVLESRCLDVNTKRNRLQTGVDKIAETKNMVDGMKVALEELQPVLTKTQIEVDELMAQIKIDKADADKTKVIVEAQESEANVKAAATKEIADSAQADLDLALPALDAAVQCLNKLKKADIDEVKSLKTPPSGVKLTAEVMCIMFGLKPIKKNDPDNPGKKFDDYWDAAKSGVFVDAKKLLHDLKTYDKDNIPQKIIDKLQPYVAMEEFTPKMIEKASKACTALCMWALAMNTYHHVALGVEPKKIALRSAQIELDGVMASLKGAQDKLQAVNDKLAALEKGFNESVAKKEALANQVKQCEIQLTNAAKLIGGLGGEEKRWRETTAQLAIDYDHLTGDCIISAGTISYLGAFVAEYRDPLVQGWREQLVGFKISHTDGCDIVQTLANPVSLRSWQIAGLPTDAVSTQNGLMMDRSRRWPLAIDPQGSANRFIKNFGKDGANCENGMDIVKANDKNFLRALENGVRFGKWVLLENVLEELDASLEPILLQLKFKQGGQVMMKIGDNTIPYNDSFKFYMTTKLPNPHYAPEVCVKVTLLNFTITMGGLQEQMLGLSVQEEMPDLAEKKAELTISNAESNKQLYDIESQILYLLSHSEGNILDDTNLIETLAAAKITSTEVSAKMAEAEITEKEIDASSAEYHPVAYRSSLLFFCIADLANVDSMYQYSLPWFKNLFCMGCGNAEKSADLPTRLNSLNEYFTYSIYQNVCRSLFEVHKLLFSFLLCIKIMQGDDKIDADEWRFLISGNRPDSREAPNPDPTWVEPQAWQEICCMSTMGAFYGFEEDFANKDNLVGWRRIFDSVEPHNATYPGRWGKCLTSLQRMCVLRALRPDKIAPALQNFVVENLEIKYIQPPPFDLPKTYNDSVNISPLIFVLSSGCDPAKDLMNFAEEMGFGERIGSIALGQGQGKIAQKMIEAGVKKGDWVLLQNCHLCVSWMPELERIVEEFDAETCSQEFRLWLTSMPTAAFPVMILQNGVKMTKEPPKGIRANLNITYYKLDDDLLNKTNKPDIYKILLFGLASFHANSIERKKFGALGWNIPYDFNETDLDISVSQLELFLNNYDEVPWSVLKVLTAVINYGGRITDDKDIRTAGIILDGYFTPEILKTGKEEGYKFSASGTYYSFQFDHDSPHKSYVDYILSLPINPEPEAFGMHENANITCARAETYETFQTILSLQPRVASGGGKSREELIGDTCHSIELRIPHLFNLDAISMQYPVRYDESMNTVLVQELTKFNRLLRAVKVSLKDCQLALKGLVVMSADLEAMGTAVNSLLVPAVWTNVAYPSLKPLMSWVDDLLARLTFEQDWIDNGIPKVYWISAFFFPQAFMTAALQNYARKMKFPIDQISFQHTFIDTPYDKIEKKPEDGAYGYGLFCEGARWSNAKKGLDDPLPKELFAVMPVIHLDPMQDKEIPLSGIYRCPVYKVLTRTGVLSTTGHSTNFVFWMDVPSDRDTVFRQSLCSETNANVMFCDQVDWIKAGVACFCALRF
jgi:dynein heavy chain